MDVIWVPIFSILKGISFCWLFLFKESILDFADVLFLSISFTCDHCYSNLPLLCPLLVS